MIRKKSSEGKTWLINKLIVSKTIFKNEGKIIAFLFKDRICSKQTYLVRNAERKSLSCQEMTLEDNSWVARSILEI